MKALVNKNRKLKKRKGFTLVEMLIVVAIIGILIGIVAIKYGNAQKKAKENADYANATNIATAVYMGQNDGKNQNEIDDVDKLVKEKYLSTAPKPQSVNSDKFTISINDEEVTISAGDKQFYPKKDKKE